jgi:hypothetical protein
MVSLAPQAFMQVMGLAAANVMLDPVGEILPFVREVFPKLAVELEALLEENGERELAICARPSPCRRLRLR